MLIIDIIVVTSITSIALGLGMSFFLRYLDERPQKKVK